MHNASVSILLPFKNAEQTIKRAIDSIIVQKLQSWQLILIENCSEDKSLQVIEPYLQDSRVMLLHESKPGIAFALNTGLNRVCSPYIARMDADDVMHDSRLKKQVSFLDENTSAGLVASQVNYLEGSVFSPGIKLFVDWNNRLISNESMRNARFIDVPVVHPSVCFRTELIEKYGGYLQASSPEDYELWLRWMEQGVRFEKINEPLLDWYDYPDRLTRKDQRYSLKEVYRLKSRYLKKYIEKNHPGFPHISLWSGGRESRVRADFLVQEGLIIDSFIDVKKREQTLFYLDIDKTKHPFIVSLVNKRGAREKIRSFLVEKGYQEMKDFILA